MVEGLRQLIKKNSGLVDKNKLRITRSLPHGHVRAVTEVMKDLGLPQMLHSHRTPKRDIITALIASRVVNPIVQIGHFP